MKFKSGTKYTWEGWKSSGKESWVFRVDHPCELMGVHAKLIDKALLPHEKIEYCLYSPRKSASSAPFGLEAEEASYGICVTDKRFIVSKNNHVNGIAPVLISIDFSNILYCNIGRTLLLGWFSISHVQDGKIKSTTITFNSTGRDYFGKAFRSYKKYGILLNENELDIDLLSVGSFIRKISDTIHRDHLRKLMTINERCISTFNCRYVWSSPKVKKLFYRKSRQSYLVSKATILLTNKALLIARDSVGFTISNSVDVLCVPLERISSCSLSRENNDKKAYKMEISFINEGTFLTLNIPLMSDAEDVEKLLFNISVILKQIKEKSCR